MMQYQVQNSLQETLDLSLDVKLDQIRSKYVHRDVVGLHRGRRDIDTKESQQCLNENGTARFEQYHITEGDSYFLRLCVARIGCEKYHRGVR